MRIRIWDTLARCPKCGGREFAEPAAARRHAPLVCAQCRAAIPRAELLGAIAQRMQERRRERH